MMKLPVIVGGNSICCVKQHTLHRADSRVWKRTPSLSPDVRSRHVSSLGRRFYFQCAQRRPGTIQDTCKHVSLLSSCLPNLVQQSHRNFPNLDSMSIFTTGSSYTRPSISVIKHSINVVQSFKDFHTSAFIGASQVPKVTTENIFSAENRASTIERLKATKQIRRPSDKNERQREAAVLIPMCLVNGTPSFLFMMRSIHLNQHRGEISFPGGMKDEGDTDLIHTALRETYEEIGLPDSKVDVWGLMKPVPARLQGTWVTPVLGFCGDVDLGDLHINKSEVEEVFTRSVSSLCHPDNTRSTQFRYNAPPSGRGMTGYTMPVFLGEGHRIWGFTAIVLYQLLHALAPGLFGFKLKHR